MKSVVLLFTFVMASWLVLNFANAQGSPARLTARNPQVLQSYSNLDSFREGLLALSPRIRTLCNSLLESQLRLQRETDSWKLYSLYEALNQEGLMTAALVRVPTVTQLSDSLPRYTGYRVASGSRVSGPIKDGSIIVTDVGTQCGPDPLSVTKGAYFLKCGSFLIGSGLIAASELALGSCQRVRVLENRSLN